jgi:hypothetical protein
MSRFALLLGGLMTLLAVFAVSVETVGVYEDEGIYESTAQSLADGKGYRIHSLPGSPPNAKYPFLYPACVAILKWIIPGSGFWEDAVLKLSNLPILMVFVWIFYRTLRDQFQWPEPSAQLTAALTGVCGTVMPFALVMMTEIPFMLAVWILLRELLRLDSPGTQPRWGLVLVAGVVIYFLRTAGVAILAAALVFLWLKGVRRKALILTGAWALAALPWMIWSKLAASAYAQQEPLLSKLLSYYLSYEYHGAALAQAVREDGWLSAAGFLATIVFKNFFTFFQGMGDVFFPISLIYAGSFVPAPQALDAFSGGVGIVAVFLAVLGYRQSQIRNKALLGLAALFHIVLFVLWPWPFAGRFLTPLVPVIMIFIAENVRRWSDHWMRLRVVVIAMSFLFQIWTLVALFPGGTVISSFLLHEDPPYHDAAQWLQPQLSEDDVVFSGFTSQWIGRKIGVPVVRYNTLLSPKTGLKLQFKVNPTDPAYANEFVVRLEEWKKVVAPRNGRLWVFAEVSLDNASWQTLETQMLRNELRLVWEKENHPVKIFEVPQ